MNRSAPPGRYKSFSDALTDGKRIGNVHSMIRALGMRMLRTNSAGDWSVIRCYRITNITGATLAGTEHGLNIDELEQWVDNFTTKTPSAEPGVRAPEPRA